MFGGNSNYGGVTKTDRERARQIASDLVSVGVLEIAPEVAHRSRLLRRLPIQLVFNERASDIGFGVMSHVCRA